MLSQNLLTKLNTQITLEFYSSNLYLQMGALCDYKGLSGSAKFFRNHATEEMSHMQKLFDYVQDTGALATIDTIKKPEIEFSDLKTFFKQLTHMKK